MPQIEPINNTIDFNVYLNTLRLKGYLAYEYNPFHNYQTNVNLYKKDEFIIPEGLAVNPKNGELLTNKGDSENPTWVDKRGTIIETIITWNQGDLYASAGSLIDLDTDLLNFDLDHPVDIEVQPSYDGSVNLILNDDKNVPRLINSRFSAREKNTYEIIDRIGENDTNIYNSETFDKDTSLYFLYEYNPKIEYKGFVKGVLPVGQYCFYFVYCDADENESDYIAETGVIPVFIGSDCDPNSIDGGIKNQVSNKGIKLKLTNLDKSYNYLKIYYLRYFADYLLNRVFECKKIYLKYYINSSNLYIQITGNEEAEDIDANYLNIERFNPKSILTLAQCKNMLFFGNIVKNSDDYKELSDCALRIVPQVFSSTLTLPDNNYNCDDPKYGYYSSVNTYNNTGYFNEEYYRFGVVFIYSNGTLSSVYNTLGGTLFDSNSSNSLNISGDLYLNNNESPVLFRNYIKVDDYGWVKNDGDKYTVNGLNVNARGVCHINLNEVEENEILGIKFNIPQQVIDHLREDLGIRGLFFVRLKCIPNILALCYLMPFDELLEGPVIKYKDGNDYSYVTECFVTQRYSDDKESGRLVSNDYNSRLYKYVNVSENVVSSISRNAYAAICPDFLLNLPYYNQIFNGAKFLLKKIVDADTNLNRNGRIYTVEDGINQINSDEYKKVTISTVTEDVPTVAINDKVYKLEMGECEEAYKFKYAEIDNSTYSAGNEDYDSVNEATNIVRGKFSPYLAIYSDSKLETGTLYNIYLEGVNSNTQEYQNRMDSLESFYAISDRYNFSELTSEVISLDEEVNYGDKSLVCWRGDCFINNFTFRLNRNFNDPSLPNNEIIIDFNTWKDNYDISLQENWTNISRSDLNAVQMGSWITFKVRSAMNYAFRSLDHSYVSEEALMGAPRSYYPRNRVMYRGANKMPDSYLYNDAYRATLGFKSYFTLNNMNYIKNSFSNRIQYSAISIQDSFKNNYRLSLSTYFRDYSQEYGGITKLVEVNGNLLVVFEHAIGLATVNERVLAGEGEGGPVFINTQNVLPEELNIITNTYGSLWSESIIKTEAGNVYGVDTVAKKIWRVSLTLEILSDLKVNKFLIDNISLGERELNPIIGLKNVKTHYNNNKKDIMFTFYDDVYKDEEKVWNLCFSEILNKFITFYSWVPSYSENIDTQFFTFDRDTSKKLSLLAKSNYSIPENIGVLADSPVLEFGLNGATATLYYASKNDTCKLTLQNEDGTTSEVFVDATKLDNGLYCLQNASFDIERDHWGFYKYVTISGNQITFDNTILDEFDKHKVIILYIRPTYSIDSKQIILPPESVAFTTKDILNNPLLTSEEKNKPGLTTDFYLHGQAGIFNVVEDTYPTYWYGRYHPFEFEVIVNDKIGYLKIFLNLVIISNKAEPESFHFEIEGDNYEFSSDKRTMYFRLEATKELFQNLGSDILFNRKYTDVLAIKNSQEQYYRGSGNGEGTRPYEVVNEYSYKHGNAYPVENTMLIQQVKSTIFPLYYEKVDTFDEIYHDYREMTGDGYDFKNLSGSEIVWNRDLNQFNIVTHIKNSPMDHVGRLRGNSRYKEGKWNILIPTISFMLKNEDKWDKPPIVINSLNLPNDLTSSNISRDNIPNIYTRTDRSNTPIYNYIDIKDWTYRKEAPIRDKWIKVRIRYSGKNLAIIHSLVTLYNVSYS